MRVGFVGWRGMVGSVLMQRMVESGDFERIDPVFFSTSNRGGAAPAVGNLTITGGKLTYRDAKSGHVTNIAIDKLALHSRGAQSPIAR